MAQSRDLRDEIDVVVKIENENECGKQTENASKFDAASSSCKLSCSPKVSKVSFEDVVVEPAQQQDKELPQIGIWRAFSSSGEEEEEGSMNNSYYYSRKNKWEFLVEKTKSKWTDPEQKCQGVFRKVNEQEEDDMEGSPEEHKIMKHKACTILQWVSLVLIIAALGCSLLVPVLKRQSLGDLPLWKWEMLILSLICGRLVSCWVIHIVVNFIEINSLLRKKVLTFVYGLQNPVQNCLWLGLVLLVWHCIFNDGVEKQTKNKVLPYVGRILACLLVGIAIWPFKTLVVKVLDSSFHMNTFFERIQDATVNQYIFETLSGPPLSERGNIQEVNKPTAEANDADDLKATLLKTSSKIGMKPPFSRTVSNKQQTGITIHDLKYLNHENIHDRNMKRMFSIVRLGTLPTMDEQIPNSDKADVSLMEIKSEFQAKEVAKKIFNNVAKPGSQCIYFDDLMRFMGKEEARVTMRRCEQAYGNERISEASLLDWLVNACKERKALASSLHCTKTAVKEIHYMINIVVAVVIVKIWLMILGIPIIHFLVFVSSQLLFAAMVLGKTSNKLFEGVVFFFITHPFDVQDKCEIDGEMMTVEEMSIITTVFRRHDNQKITYPNSLLANKQICNLNRSHGITEKIEFRVHISTPKEKISILKQRIISYAEEHRQHWQGTPSVFVKDLEDMNRVNLSVWITHKLKFPKTIERWNIRGLLLEEIISIFKELEIEHRMPPLDVNVRNMPALTSTSLP